MNDAVAVAIVKPAGEALAFVMSSWLKSYKARGCALHGLDDATYYRSYHPELMRLIARCNVALATLEDDADAYMGWACGTDGVLHYVYVKWPYRQHGIARTLMAAAAGEPKIYTFEPSTKDGALRKSVAKVAERHGWKHHAHPIPGVLVAKQLKEAKIA